MRYVIYGAGAIGGTIGGALALQGHDVVLIARGAHLEALRRGGLLLRTPDADHHLGLAAVESAGDARPAAGDVVVLATKSQDTSGALDALAAAADPGALVVCAQNGVANEPMALRQFSRVCGMCVVVPATHLEPGVVLAHSAPVLGVLEIGRYPGGDDPGITTFGQDLNGAGFDTRVRADVMRWKYAKLLDNLSNALDAAAGRASVRGDLYRRARGEAIACFEAAGIEWANDDEERERRRAMSPLRPVAGVAHQGGSSWQSLERGTGRIEADWLNGEIVLLGRLHGIATPVNTALQQLANRMARRRIPARSVPLETIEALVAQAV